MKIKKTKFNKLILFIAVALFAIIALPTINLNALETETNITFTAGQLELKSVPRINFGTHEISGTTQTYPAASITDKIVVSDLRGNGQGWNVKASLSEFTSNGNVTLKDAILKVSAATVSAVSGTTATAPTPNTNLELTAGQASNYVFSADVNEGLGVWELEWSTANTTLTVYPGTATIGASTATINWSIESTP